MDKAQITDIEELTPKMLATMSGGWRERKSVEMRILILESVIDVLVEKGYSGLTIPFLTERAGISRGALHHHFATKMQLVTGVTEYIFYKRIQRFLQDFRDAAARPAYAVEDATSAYWESLQTREFAAYLEVAMAARTDPDLKKYFNPASKRFDRIWSDEMIPAFPEWESNWRKLQQASDMVAATHMGLLLLRDTFGEERVQDTLSLTISVVRKLYEGEL